jgi:hypothetical protein
MASSAVRVGLGKVQLWKLIHEPVEAGQPLVLLLDVAAFADAFRRRGLRLGLGRVNGVVARQTLLGSIVDILARLQLLGGRQGFCGGFLLARCGLCRTDLNQGLAADRGSGGRRLRKGCGRIKHRQCQYDFLHLEMSE